MFKKYSTVFISAFLSLFLVSGAFAAENIASPGSRHVSVKDIVISESAAGIFKKDKYIYLFAEHLTFEDGVAASVQEGDLKIDEVSALGSVLKIKIKSESSKASKIVISNVSLYLDSSLPSGVYSLKVAATENDTYKDNVFGSSEGDSDEVKYITLIENFVQIAEKEDYETQTATVGNSYVDKDGAVMLPVREVTSAFSDKTIVSWDSEKRQVSIITGKRVILFKADSNVMIINGTSVYMQKPAVITGGRIHASLSDLAYALGVSESQIIINK
ncbi:MAG: copper amine oxidase N-terminal domain-containing protein [Lachnospiraceae bacterium]|nr:copper amine oxidase N-terminal domain-containing protein [Lachnospiraceae bacterium]